MKDGSPEFRSGVKLLAQALRAIRKKRGMSVTEVAAAMDMPRRTYEEFEAGRGPVTHDRIFAFADVTNCDPYALILAVDFHMPQFAIDCADTKLALILMVQLRLFAEAQGGDIRYLQPTNIIGAAERLFGDLAAKLSNSEEFLKNWLEGRTGSIGLNGLRTRSIGRKPTGDS